MSVDHRLVKQFSRMPSTESLITSDPKPLRPPASLRENAVVLLRALVCAKRCGQVFA